MLRFRTHCERRFQLVKLGGAGRTHFLTIVDTIASQQSKHSYQGTFQFETLGVRTTASVVSVGNGWGGCETSQISSPWSTVHSFTAFNSYLKRSSISLGLSHFSSFISLGRPAQLRSQPQLTKLNYRCSTPVRTLFNLEAS
jgi:hypothetical protein